MKNKGILKSYPIILWLYSNQLSVRETKTNIKNEFNKHIITNKILYFLKNWLLKINFIKIVTKYVRINIGPVLKCKKVVIIIKKNDLKYLFLWSAHKLKNIEDIAKPVLIALLVELKTGQVWIIIKYKVKKNNKEELLLILKKQYNNFPTL